jgi:hypothetical protein
MKPGLPAAAGTVAAALLISLGIAPASARTGTPQPAPEATPVQVTAGATTADVDAALGHGTGSISGRLLAAGTNEPIVGEPVVALGPKMNLRGEGTTGNDGRFTLDGIGPAPEGLHLCTYHDEEHPVARDYAQLCYPHVYWSPARGVPAAANSVPLADGEHKNVGTLHIARGASITGRVRTEFGNDLGDVNVFFRSLSDKRLRFDLNSSYGEGTDLRTGRYEISGLPPSAAGWEVCFANKTGLVVKNGPDPYGYLNGCYRDKPWRGKRLPARATPVRVGAGRTVHKINATANLGGQLIGRVVDQRGKALSADVTVYNTSGRVLASGHTQHGQYRIGGLPRTSVGKVCARPSTVYSPKCRNHRVAVRPHSKAAGPDFVLAKVPHSNGTIQGTVTAAESGDPVQSADVSVFDKHGNWLGETVETHAQGGYNLERLDSGHRYIVCVSTATAHVDEGMLPSSECYVDASWDGRLNDVPAAAQPIALTHRHLRGVDFALPPGGAISGRVTAADDGSALATDVYLYTADGVALGRTRSSAGDGGAYRFDGLTGGHYFVCFSGAAAEPHGHYLGQCYSHVAWPH